MRSGLRSDSAAAFGAGASDIRAWKATHAAISVAIILGPGQSLTCREAIWTYQSSRVELKNGLGLWAMTETSRVLCGWEASSLLEFSAARGQNH